MVTNQKYDLAKVKKTRELQNISNALSTVCENLVSFTSLCYKNRKTAFLTRRGRGRGKPRQFATLAEMETGPS